MKRKKKAGYLSKSKKENSMGSALEIITIITFIVGIFFLSPKFTGNVVSSLSLVFLNWVGILLLFLGLIEVFFILKKNKNFH